MGVTLVQIDLPMLGIGKSRVDALLTMRRQAGMGVTPLQRSSKKALRLQLKSVSQHGNGDL